MTKNGIDLLLNTISGQPLTNVKPSTYKMINDYVNKYDYASVCDLLLCCSNNKEKFEYGIKNYRDYLKPKLTEQEYMEQDDKNYNEIKEIKEFFEMNKTKETARQFRDDLDIYNKVWFNDMYNYSKELNQSISKLCERKGMIPWLLQW